MKKNLCFLILILLPSLLLSTEQQNFTDLSLEELMNVELTSISKKSQRLSTTAAAVYVLTEEEIRRSGATNIPDLLRLVPGMEVARLTSNTWAISARGFNGEFSNKLLVMIDGRSVYTPLFTGVYWDSTDTLLEDIERIEVIRGPAGTIWGSNAINGVVNIITKSSKDNQGRLVAFGGGTEEHGFGAARHSGSLNSKVHYRFYGKAFNRDDGHHPTAAPQDEWWQARAGSRWDIDLNSKNNLVLTGGYYKGESGNISTQGATRDVDLSGFHILSRWKHHHSESSNLSFQFYLDNFERSTELLRQKQNVYDFDFSHHFKIPLQQEITWGLAYRLSEDSQEGSAVISFAPEKNYVHLFSFFLQDEISLVKDLLTLTLGSKFEVNEYTGFEFQPSGRLAWQVTPNNTIWTAISRSVRTPSRFTEDARLNIPAGAQPLALVGSKDFESEILYAFELGYRSLSLNNVAFDIAGFYNIYDELATLEAQDPLPDGYLPLVFDNKMKGKSYGTELSTSLKPVDWWTWRLGYSFMKIDLELKEGSTDGTFFFPASGAENQSPKHQFSLRSYLDLPNNVYFDSTLRFVDKLNDSQGERYAVVDLRLAWAAAKGLELSVAGRNLFNHHQEFGSGAGDNQITVVEPSVYAKLQLEF